METTLPSPIGARILRGAWRAAVGVGLAGALALAVVYHSVRADA